MKIFAKLKNACCYLMSLCHVVMLKNTLVALALCFQIKFKSLKVKVYDPHKSTRFLF